MKMILSEESRVKTEGTISKIPYTSQKLAVSQELQMMSRHLIGHIYC